jgi:predicted RNA-binding Zn ribbon-like protein
MSLAPPVRKSDSSPRDKSTAFPRELIAHQVGGHLALDFCNTAGEHLAARPDEFLRDWESFLRWAAQVGLIASNSYFELLRKPHSVEPIVKLRDAIYRIGLAAAGKRELSESDIVLVRKYAGAKKPQVEIHKGKLYWKPLLSRGAQELCAVLAGEALSLFCSPKAARIGVCEGGMCGWLYVDESRGQRRRWCDMNDCGSRAKARRYYETHKGS